MSIENNNINVCDIEELRKKLQKVIAGKHIANLSLNQTCYFCDESDADPTCSAVIDITHKMSKYSQRSTVKKISVQRCKKCKSVHGRAFTIGCIPAGISFITLFIIIIIPIYSDWIPFEGYEKLQKWFRSAHTPFLMKLLLVSSPFWFPSVLFKGISYIVPDFLSGNTKPLRDGYNYPPAKEAWKEQKIKFPIYSKRSIS